MLNEDILMKPLEAYCSECRHFQDIYADYLFGKPVTEMTKEDAFAGAKRMRSLYDNILSNGNIPEPIKSEFKKRCGNEFKKPDGETYHCCFYSLIINDNKRRRVG